MTSRLPWWLKLGVKLGATAAGVPHKVRNLLGFDRHGPMEDPAYAIEVVRHHLAALGHPEAPFRALEVGPGDSPLGALIAASAGASETWLVDAGPFANYRPAAQEATYMQLQSLGFDPPGQSRMESFRQYLDALNAHYLTNGLESMAELPSDYIDVAWSHAVLEHVRGDEFDALMRELHRVLSFDPPMR